MAISLLFAFLGGVALAVAAFYIAAVSLRGRVDRAIASQLEPSLERLEGFRQKVPELNQALERLNSQAHKAQEVVQAISALTEPVRQIAALASQLVKHEQQLRTFETTMTTVLEPSAKHLKAIKDTLPGLQTGLTTLKRQAEEARSTVDAGAKLHKTVNDLAAVAQECATALAHLQSFSTVVEDIRRNGVELLTPNKDKDKLTRQIVLVLPKPDKGNFDKIMNIVRHFIGGK